MGVSIDLTLFSHYRSTTNFIVFVLAVFGRVKLLAQPYEHTETNIEHTIKT